MVRHQRVGPHQPGHSNRCLLNFKCVQRQAKQGRQSRAGKAGQIRMGGESARHGVKGECRGSWRCKGLAREQAACSAERQATSSGCLPALAARPPARALPPSPARSLYLHAHGLPLPQYLHLSQVAAELLGREVACSERASAGERAGGRVKKGHVPERARAGEGSLRRSALQLRAQRLSHRWRKQVAGAPTATVHTARQVDRPKRAHTTQARASSGHRGDVALTHQRQCAPQCGRARCRRRPPAHHSAAQHQHSAAQHRHSAWSQT